MIKPLELECLPAFLIHVKVSNGHHKPSKYIQDWPGERFAYPMQTTNVGRNIGSLLGL